jgi:predicted TIM-barrel fold metal-dependent hydrolase
MCTVHNEELLEVNSSRLLEDALCETPKLKIVTNHWSSGLVYPFPAKP